MSKYKRLFLMPIYFRTFRKYESFHQRRRDKERESIEKHRALAPDWVEKKLSQTVSDYDRYRWYPHKINDVCGWLEIAYFSGQIHLSHYYPKKRDTQSERPKRFSNTGTYWYVIDSSIEKVNVSRAKAESNDKIFQSVLIMIRKWESEYLPKARYIDYECLESIGPNIDWNALVASDSA